MMCNIMYMSVWWILQDPVVIFVCSPTYKLPAHHPYICTTCFLLLQGKGKCVKCKVGDDQPTLHLQRKILSHIKHVPIISLLFMSLFVAVIFVCVIILRYRMSIKFGGELSLANW